MAYTIDRLARDTGLSRRFLNSAFKDAKHLAGGDADAAMELLLDRLDMCEDLVSAGTPFEQAWKGTSFAAGAKRQRIIANAKANSSKASGKVKKIVRWLRK